MLPLLEHYCLYLEISKMSKEMHSYSNKQFQGFGNYQLIKGTPSLI